MKMPRIAMLSFPGTLLFTAACAEERLVEVIDLPPEFSGMEALVTDEDTPTEPLTITVTDTETEEDGIALSVAVLDDTLVPEDGISLIQDGQDFTLVLTPALNQFGNTEVIFTATDSKGQETVEAVALTVNPINDPPVADDQTRNGIGTDALTLTLTASDVENDPLTFEIVDAPLYGTLSGEAPALVYTPNADLTFVDSFTFIANDGTDDSNLATVTLNIEGVNQPPVGLPDAYEAVGGCAVIADAATGLLANDSDEDGDLIQATLVTQPRKRGYSSGRLVYLHPDTAINPISFTYVSSDGVGESTPTTVTITIDSDGILVTTEADGDASDGLCSLREAIQAANTDSVVDTCTWQAQAKTESSLDSALRPTR